MLKRQQGRMNKIVLVVIMSLLTRSVVFSQNVPARNDRMEWWREARFGLFIHWGLYAVPAGYWNGKSVPGIGEWIMNYGKIPVKDYAAIAGQFNPVKFNADEWVSIAKNAGMKYIVITAKHHDGFAMFKSNASNFNIVDATPFKRDVLKELAVACRKQHMKLGFYYSQAQDWSHAGGAIKGAAWDSLQNGSMKDYIKKIAVPQVRELLTNYGDVAVIFWDTPFNMNKQFDDAIEAQLRLQPNIITNDRLAEHYDRGDYNTPEQFIPVFGIPGFNWETNMTMNGTWGFRKDDKAWKSPKTVIRNLIEVASKGGNYLLNVGPDGNGEIPLACVDRLKIIGDWLKINGEAIYDTKASPLSRQPEWGRCTAKSGKLYLHVFDWTAADAQGRLTLKVPMLNKITHVYLLSKPDKNIDVAYDKEGLKIPLTSQDRDTLATVVAIEYKGDFRNIAYPPITEKSDGVLYLTAADASLNYISERKGLKSPILQWKAQISAPGTYDVILDYNWGPGNEGDEFVMRIGQQSLKAKGGFVKKWSMVQKVPMGSIEIAKKGLNTFSIRSMLNINMGLMRVRGIWIKPVSATTLNNN